mmetsp:Transcript_19653/g.42311  ORF Transcript_19653/g.42311 Transcript_19653/m.42311 type:complete len:85 (-) Transcript_19653:1105-1359(-)
MSLTVDSFVATGFVNGLTGCKSEKKRMSMGLRVQNVIALHRKSLLHRLLRNISNTDRQTEISATSRPSGTIPRHIKERKQHDQQ